MEQPSIHTRRATGTNFVGILPWRGSVLLRSKLRATVACIVLALIVSATIGGTVVRAQWKPWKISTPRDSIYVPASQRTPWVHLAYTPECISTKFYFSGTFGAFPWQDSAGFDARWTYSDAAWAAPFPLKNPPSWNFLNYQVYLEISNRNGFFSDTDSVRVLETAYQPSHQYTAVYPGAGDYFYFRIYDQLNTAPNGSDYKQATGGITIHSAQFTAGISIQSESLPFPITNVGTSSVLLDSIASYGLDPLEIDTVWIKGPQASNFSITSQRGTHFSLDSAAANQFAVTYTPSVPEVMSTAWLFLRSPNADCGHRLDSIALTGYSAAPNGTIGPDTLDFGTQRAGSFTPLDANVYNSGNADYLVTNISITPSNTIFTTPANSYPIRIPHGPYQLQFNFRPASTQSYQATAYITDGENNVRKIVLIGNGATPHVVASDTELNFGTVFTNNTTVLFDTITNIGNWNAHVSSANLGCTNPNWFSFDPPDTSFDLDAGQSRIYTVTFKPATTINTSLSACLKFFLDDGSQPEVIHLDGVEKQRDIKYAANVVDFGRVKVGNSKYDTVGALNLSSRAINLSYTFNPISNVFQLSGKDSTTLNVGNDILPLLFKPNVHGPASAWMHLLTSNSQIDSIFMFGFGAEPKPVFSPDTINFGTCFDASQNYGKTLITDTGDYPLYICSANVVGADSTEFTIIRPPALPFTVPDSGMGSLLIELNFTTTARAGGTVHHATLQIHYCDGTIDSVPLRATEATESVQACWNEIDFGRVHIGSTKDTGVCYTNPESISLPIDTIRVSPAGIPFSSKDNTANVAPFGHYSDSLTFAPTFRSHFKGWLYGGGGGMTDDSILITGIGAQSVPLLSTHQLNFGKQPRLVTSNAQLLTLKDTGDWELVTQIEKINDTNSEFSVMLQSGASVNPTAEDTVDTSATSTYTVTFTPRVPQLPDHEAKLVFHYQDRMMNDTVILIGKDRSGFLAFNRDTVDFGIVRVGAPPATSIIQIINTSDTALTATQIAEPNAPFSANPNTTPITVDSDNSKAIQLSFTPTAIGPVQSVIAGIGSPFNSSVRDTVVLIGTGAKPVPTLSVDTLFFDTVALGRVVTRNFTLSNTGNWPLIVSSAVSTVNPAGIQDFTATVPTDTTIDTSGMVTYAVTFTSTAPIQATPRIGYIIWTLDDGSEDTLVLVANDVQPLKVKIGFPKSYWGRPGDKIAAELDLQSTIPDTMLINHLSGTITYDPTMVDFKNIGPGNIDSTSKWNFKWNVVPGTIGYDISSADSVLTKTGTLLNIMFQMHQNLQEGTSSQLFGFDTIVGTQEAIATPTPASTTIFLDSICGTIHLLDGGQPIASYIEQNIPNPVGSGGTSTTVPFNVGDDNTIVSIRLLDPTGREVLRPVDHLPFACGRYQITIDATSLPAGIYFYEFQANGQTPQMLKMAVE
jgi:hypothetical protein